MSTVLPDLIESTDAAASTATAYTISAGQSAQGNLSSLGDHDWYRVTLTAGQTYSFAMVGTGTNNVQNAYLYLRDASGTQIAVDDDSGPGTNATIVYTPSTTGTYYLDAAAFNNAGTGQYGISVTAGSRPTYDIAMGGGAIDTNYSWSTPGTGATITFGFRATTATYDTIPNFSQCSAAEMTALRSILQLWSDVCNVTFVDVNPTGYTDNATILIGNYNDPNDGAGAYAYYPGSTASNNWAGDLWLNLGGGISTSSVPMGSYSWFAIMHELGHALGLSHPGDYNAAPGVDITYSQFAQFTQDTEQYSVMSYFDGSNTGQSPGNFATADTPMLYDIYELQQIYGVNTTTRTGDTVYGFNSNAGNAYNFSVNTTPIFCIWDAGGNDTLDCSGYSQSQVINLNGGTFSNIGGQTYNVSIAIGADIENATGGTGNDTITGNSTNNTFRGGGGTDTINGGAGWDRTIFNFASNTATLSQNPTTLAWTISGSGQSETLTNVEVAQFSDGTTRALRERPRSDFDGNNCSDILWRAGSTGPIIQTRMNGFSVIGSGNLGGDANWGLVGTGDFNGDGHTDLLWRYAPTGAVFETLMNGSNVLLSQGIGGDGTWSIAGTGDFNGDGMTDILWRAGPTGPVYESQMNGFTVLGSQSLGGSGQTIAGTGDFNGDGKSDILWRASSGSVVEKQMNGFTVLGSQSLGGDTNWSVTNTGDFNGDGRTDILWQFSPTGSVYENLMNGFTVSSSQSIGGDANWSVAGTGDFNGDARTDILWRFASTGAVYENLMNGFTVTGSQSIGGDTTMRPLVV